MREPRSKTPIIISLFLVLLALSITLILLECKKRSVAKLDRGEKENQNNAEETQANKNSSHAELKSSEYDTFVHPMELVSAIANAIANQQNTDLKSLIGEKICTPEISQRLLNLPHKLKTPKAIREVGELVMGDKIRYTIQLESPQEQKIFLDVEKKKQAWYVADLRLPPDRFTDALGGTDAFISAALKQDFVGMKKLLHGQAVSDPALATLCILFEEGAYHLRPQKPIRPVISKEKIASFLVNVESDGDSQPGQFALNLKHDQDQWKITELNFDDLLTDYSKRIGGGDVFYTPLIKNPKGGDTLVLYFDFAEEGFSTRTERQLAIVALLLKTDANKKIHLTGHTDAIGGEDFNQTLSDKRAQNVRSYLVAKGVSPTQIVTSAKGLSQPRLPNTLDGGKDNPNGRRVNRRAEIYLDF